MRPGPTDPLQRLVESTQAAGRGAGSASQPRRGPPRIAGYELLGELGRGGMGQVFRARDRQAGREVAIKLVLAGEPEDSSLERFRREGLLTASLDDPGIVRVHSAGVCEGRPYLVYELVPGARTLEELAPELPLLRRVELLREAARALGVAHAQGVVHRDVKAENLLIDAQGRLRVADFGLATAPGLERLTVTGGLVGTPGTMAPEQIAGRREAVGPPTDVWALGVVLYQLLTGQAPFWGDSLISLSAAIVRAKPTPPRELDPGLPVGLERVCLGALQREPRQRYPDGAAFAQAIDDALAGRLSPPRRGRLGAALIGGLGLLALAGAWGLGEESPPPPERAPQATPPPPSPTPRPRPHPAQPAWFAALPAESRPPQPLPPDLQVGLSPGEFLNRRDGSVLCYVPPGELIRGRDRSHPSEGPAHRVRLTRGFFLGKHEVSNAQLQRYRDSAPETSCDRWPVRVVPEQPATSVSWEEARAYCEWAGGRLPSEAEWELAARGHDGRRYPWGDEVDIAHRRCNANGTADGYPAKAPVDAFPQGASPYGCLNMAGNVWEWVADWFAPYAAGPQVDPRGPEFGRLKVHRGGAYDTEVGSLRTSKRLALEPAHSNESLGFRLCISAGE